MPKKKTHHRKTKAKAKHKGSQHSHLTYGPEIGGHHARLRKLHAAGGHRVGQHTEPHHHKGRKKATKRHAKHRTSSALMDRLRRAEAGAREQMKKVGRHKAPRHEKLVTEQTLRHQMALKCLHRCSH
jgi:hypothetical protein